MIKFDSSKEDIHCLSRQNPIRINEQGHIHFVTTSCMNRRPFFSESWICKIVVESLNVARARKGFLILGYVIMPEHVHLLVVPNQCGHISNAMQWIKWYTSKQVLQTFRNQGERIQKLWLPRFYDFNIFTYEKLIEKLNYCHMNPVKRNLVPTPELWDFSSFRSYEYNDDTVFRVDRWWDYWT